MSSPADLPRRLRRCREAAGISQIRMASHLNLNHSSAVAKIEAGARKISVEEFAKWCGLCGVTTDDVLDGKPITVSIVDSGAAS